MRRISFAEGEYYHLYNRGVDKRVIFSDPQEYKRFLAYLYILNDSERIRATELIESRGLSDVFLEERGSRFVAIGAFCLMPNHFHIYVTPLVKDGVSKFMHRVQTAYTMFFNKKHERSGSLFSGTFKAQHVDRDAYARYLFSYIHLNPAKLADPQWRERGPRDLRKIMTSVREYPYSSLREYISGEHVLTDPKKFPGYLARMSDVDEHVDTWLRYAGQIREA